MKTLSGYRDCNIDNIYSVLGTQIRYLSDIVQSDRERLQANPEPC